MLLLLLIFLACTARRGVHIPIYLYICCTIHNSVPGFSLYMLYDTKHIIKNKNSQNGILNHYTWTVGWSEITEQRLVALLGRPVSFSCFFSLLLATWHKLPKRERASEHRERDEMIEPHLMVCLICFRFGLLPLFFCEWTALIVYIQHATTASIWDIFLVWNTKQKVSAKRETFSFSVSVFLFVVISVFNVLTDAGLSTMILMKWSTGQKRNNRTHAPPKTITISKWAIWILIHWSLAFALLLDEISRKKEKKT